MELVEYLDKKEAELKDIYLDKFDEDLWKEIKSQIKSGANVGLSYEQCDLFATFDFDYEQREVIKFVCMSGVSKEIVEKLLNATIERNMSAKAMIRFYDECRYENSSMKQIDEKFNFIKEHTLSVESLINGLIEDKKLRMTISQLEEKENILSEKLVAANHRIEELVEEIRHLNDHANHEEKVVDVIEVKSKRKLFSKKHKERAGPINAKKTEFLDFKVQELPKGFNLSTYLLNSSLSSSQMNIITIAVKLGVNTSLIKQMIDSGLEAEKLKTVLEILVSQMEQEKHISNPLPDDIRLFEEEIDISNDINNNQCN